MANRLFDSVKGNRPKLNKFDLSHERKFSMNMGKLIPILVQETLPGDKFRVNSEVILRVAPMLAPIMHRVNIKVEYFFVPMRLIWNEWEEFITGGRLGTSAPVAPYVNVEDGMEIYLAAGQLADYLGVPPPPGTFPSSAPFEQISVLPFRAYQLIWREFYRDQTLQGDPGVYPDFSRASGQVTVAQFVNQTLGNLRDSCWEKDYLTSAVPSAQRGGAVSLPIEMDANDITYKYPATVGDGVIGAVAGNLTTDVSAQVNAVFPIVGAAPAGIENIEDIESTSVTIEALRRAVMLQQWLEKMSRGGARYIEQMKMMWDVVSSDARLQRPEYLGGGKAAVSISEVLSTFEDDAGSIPQGNMSGHGIGVGNQMGFTRRFEEHGFVMGMMRVLPRTNYQDGLPRMWSRKDKFDYPWPDFAHLGEQPVLNREVWWSAEEGGAGNQNEGTWGYQSRYCEWKYGMSTVHGDFRTSLDYWTMAREFASLPPLDNLFVQADPTHRIFPVTDPSVHKLYCLIHHDVSALRKLPYFGTPRL